MLGLPAGQACALPYGKDYGLSQNIHFKTTPQINGYNFQMPVGQNDQVVSKCPLTLRKRKVPPGSFSRLNY